MELVQHDVFLFHLKRILALMLLTALTACSKDTENKLYSNELLALKKVVAIPNEVLSAKWEIFRSPEYANIPGPSDFVALVAQIEIKDGSFLTRPSVDAKEEYIVPQASRPWLSKEFKTLMAKHQNSRIEISQIGDCSPYSAKMTKGGRLVNGIACVSGNRYLIYLLLQSDSQ
jgi:hypothetical protein